MAVIGVLGHTDHGKSTLLERLTGVNPMHLPEEKERGLTIQLGFAFWEPELNEFPKLRAQLIDLGKISESTKYRISFIDVPGHEMFLRKMLRGVLGIDGAILVVSADDGIMPGTLEHLRASLYSPTRLGLIVISKIDKVSMDRVDDVKRQIRSITKGTYWENSRIVQYSSETMVGFQELREEILQMAIRADEASTSYSVGYYFVDRIFTAKGRGAIVTGTLRGQEVSIGDELYLYPKSRKVRVRSIEQGGVEVSLARHNFRTAFNLVGVKKEEISQGDLILTKQINEPVSSFFILLVEPPDALKPEVQLSTTLARAKEKFNLIFGSRLCEFNEILLFHLFSQIHLGFIRGKVDIPIPIGCSAIVYRTSVRSVIVGGFLIPLAIPAPKTKRTLVTKIDELKRLFLITASKDSPTEISLAILALLSQLVFKGYVSRTFYTSFSLLQFNDFSLAFDLLSEKLNNNEFGRDGEIIFSRKELQEELNRLKVNLVKFRETNLSKAKVPLSTILQDECILKKLSEEHISKLILELGLKFEDGNVVISEDSALPPDLRAVGERILARFQSGVENYPTLLALSSDFPGARNIISWLISNGKLVHLGKGVLITGIDFQDWSLKVVSRMQETQQISTQEAKSILGVTRKFLIPFLEFLDSLKITQREGEVRVPGRKFDQVEKIISSIGKH